MNVNLGCGFEYLPGFLGIDLIKSSSTNLIADISRLPIKKGCISKVYSRRCIQHIKDDKKVFNEIFRILKPNGKYTIILSSFIGWIYYKTGLSASAGHYAVFHLYTEHKIKRMLPQTRVERIRFDYKITGKK